MTESVCIHGFKPDLNNHDASLPLNILCQFTNVVISCLIYVYYVHSRCRVTFLFPEDGYSIPESYEVKNLIYTMFIFTLVLGFIIKLRFPKNTSVCDVKKNIPE